VVKIFQNLIEFLFPPACPLCDAPVSTHGQLCADCWGAINWIDNPKCAKCGYPFSADIDLGGAPLCPVCASGQCELDWIRCACVYDDVSRSAMLPFKHAGRTKYSLFMSHAMIWALRDINVDADVVMPVPLANKRLFKRGYNQATLLARPISRALNIKMDLDSVVRAHREMMGHKNARERAENIRGVFSVVNPDAVRGKRILLVDDVMTTGATFSELRRILVRSGAAAVYGVAFCRAVRAI
jgi:ComF family protein